MITSIHDNIKRCLLSDAGVRNAYLDENDSLLLEGTTYKDAQAAAASTAGLELDGTYPNASVGQYVVNETKDFFAEILAITTGTLTIHYPLQTAGTNWGQATATTVSKLIDSTAIFTTTAQVGMIVALRDLSDYAVITAIDSDTQLSLSKDSLSSGDDYTLMQGFEVGDNVKVGTAILDGTEGQVMVEIPKFYYRYSYEAGHKEAGHKWAISPVPVAGFALHPAFTPADVEKDYVYYGAFDGVIDSRGQGTNNLTSYSLGTTKLASVPGLHQVTNGQRSEFRTVTSNRGAGWAQQDWNILWAAQLLFLIEFESLDSQLSMGDGMTDWETNTWTSGYNGTVGGSSYYAASQTGFSLREGNNSNNLSGGNGNIGSYNSYRGIENFWGNIWKWTDGVNYNDGQVYLANDPSNYADNIATTPYFDTGFNQPISNGYISEIQQSEHGFIVRSSNGGSSTYIPDYYWYNSGWRVARSGGNASTGALAGFAALVTSNSSALRHALIGSRACFR